ncbi:MAG: hypothetical protein BWK80_52245 [Desulfobacteraceae bacterium IS3]|nr:MAG: hypothetical protein BWK80_52245 [Desulfobacteraceae bacterium IS3]
MSGENDFDREMDEKEEDIDFEAEMEAEAETEVKEESPEEVLANKIVTYYGYFGEYSLKGIAKTCAKLIISERYRDLCFENFDFPTQEEMKDWVLEEMKQNFDEKVVPLIEQTYPDMSEDDIEAEVAKLEKKYEKEHEEQLMSTTKAALKELRIRVRALQKELNALKRKYTI